MSNGVRTVFSGKPDYKRAENALNRYEAVFKSSNSDKYELYCLVSEFFQALFISDNGYVIDTGNFEQVNMEILEDILKNVRKHPTLWKCFMVC